MANYTINFLSQQFVLKLKVITLPDIFKISKFKSPTVMKMIMLILLYYIRDYYNNSIKQSKD